MNVDFLKPLFAGKPPGVVMGEELDSSVSASENQCSRSGI